VNRRVVHRAAVHLALTPRRCTYRIGCSVSRPATEWTASVQRRVGDLHEYGLLSNRPFVTLSDRAGLRLLALPEQTRCGTVCCSSASYGCARLTAAGCTRYALKPVGVIVARLAWRIFDAPLGYLVLAVGPPGAAGRSDGQEVRLGAATIRPEPGQSRARPAPRPPPPPCR
jgi:hypothetical protein